MTETESPGDFSYFATATKLNGSTEIEADINITDVTPYEYKLQGERGQLSQALHAFRCNSPLFPNDFGAVVKIQSNSTIGEAFKKLIHCQILSIPVVHYITGKPLYVLSMMHIIEYLINTYRQEDFSDNLWNKLKTFIGGSKPDQFMNTSLEVLEGSKSYHLDKAITIDQNEAIAEALRLLASTGAHRVLVSNTDHELVNVITQSRLVQFISNMVDSIPKCDKTIAELKLGMKNVVCVLDSQTTYEAFKIMKERKISGVAVVNSLGTLLGNISTSDLKLVGYNLTYWSYLSKPVKEYLQAVRSKPESKIKSHVFALLEDTNARYPLIVRCRPHHTFGFVIRLVAYYKVHRLYLVDDIGSPIGVITLTDILREIAKDI